LYKGVEDIIREILGKKPELTKEDILKLMRRKKEGVRGEYLTDLGALFLVATDLGVKIVFTPIKHIKISDLKPGMREANLVVRLLSCYPPKVYVDRSGTERTYRNIVVYDTTGAVDCILWDENVGKFNNLPAEPGFGLEIRKGRIRARRDRVVLHAGRRSDVVPLGEEDPLLRRIPPLGDITVPVSKLSAGRDHMVVEGVVASEPSLREYKRRSGERAFFLSFNLKDRDTASTVRSVLWIKEKPSFKITKGSLIHIINVKTKRTLTGELEVHGDEGSSIKVIKITQLHQPNIVKLLSVGPLMYSRSGRKMRVALAMDEKKTFITIYAMEDSLEEFQKFATGDILEILSPFRGDRVLIEGKEEVRRFTGVKEFPCIEEVKISEIREALPDLPLFVRGVVLTRSEVFDVPVGERMIRKSLVVLGDETGEIRLVGWEESSYLLSDLNITDKVLVKAVHKKIAKDGTPFLLLKNFSSIEKLS